MTIASTLRTIFSPARSLLAPTGDGLTASDHATRSAALEAAREAATVARDRRLAELQKQIDATNAEHAHAVGSAEQTAEQARQKRAAEIVAEFYATVTPLVQSWIAEPTRTTSAAIRAAVLEFSDRSESDLGTTAGRAGNGNPMRTELLAYAFCDALLEQFPAAVNVFGASDTGELFAWPLSALDNPVAFQAALAALEARLVARASQTAGQTPDERLARRYALLRGLATHRDVMRAAADFDATEKRKADEATAQARTALAERFRASLI